MASDNEFTTFEKEYKMIKENGVLRPSMQTLKDKKT